MANSVLVVEDNVTVRTLLIRLIRRANPEACVVDVEGGEDALEMFSRHHPNLVLLDHGLPDINGFAVLERLKLQSDAPYVIMITGDPSLEAEAFAYGADEVWLKPMDVGQMLPHLAHLLVAHQ
ncbi:MAG: response regulator [Chloroflexota bacterium]|nr:response regulator [Chloroflexota bacterium]